MSNGKRGRTKDPYNETVCKALSEKFPKFTKSQLSMVRNPEYGLQMASEALAELKAKGIPPPVKKRSHFVKTISQRKKPNRVTVRLNDAQKDMLMKAKEKSGCRSLQEYLEKLIAEGTDGTKDDAVLEMPSGNERTV